MRHAATALQEHQQGDAAALLPPPAPRRYNSTTGDPLLSPAYTHPDVPLTSTQEEAELHPHMQPFAPHWSWDSADAQAWWAPLGTPQDCLAAAPEARVRCTPLAALSSPPSFRLLSPTQAREPHQSARCIPEDTLAMTSLLLASYLCADRHRVSRTHCKRGLSRRRSNGFAALCRRRGAGSLHCAGG